jgi:rhodanese-related sulfurtransferase
LFFAVPLPYSRLELDVSRLAPRPSVSIVVYGDGNRLAGLAAARLEALGYRNVSILDGGIAAWRDASLPLFAGVNLPSKAFGEVAEHAYATPRVSPSDLAAWIEAGDDLIVLDGRPFSEYRKMNIPGSICCPNGELGYRVKDLVPDKTTKIVINCAGRTRSIIGAQTLINLGLENPIYALENGTQGWFLADLPLEHGSHRRWPDLPTPSGLAEAREAAAKLAARFRVPFLSADQLVEWLADSTRTTFLCDVRTETEFAEATLRGAQHTPGGQLVQATDHYLGVRGARIVVFDAEMVRAPIIASWLRQMGLDAFVLKEGLNSDFPRANGKVTAAPPDFFLPSVSVTALSQELATAPPLLVDVRSSAQFRHGHIPGAIWSIRPRLAEQFAGHSGPIVVIADDPGVGQLAARELEDALGGPVRLLDAGFANWAKAGLPIEVTPADPPDEHRIDYLFFVHDRHDGNKEAARRYLAWETGLVGRLVRGELSRFRPAEEAPRQV